MKKLDIEFYNKLIKEKLDKYNGNYFHYIYMIAFPNGWIYIGQRQHENPEEDLDYMGSGIDSSKALEEFGKENCLKFILKIIPWDPIRINLFEISYIKKYRSFMPDRIYNILDGPPFGPFSINASLYPEVVEKLRKALIGKNKGKKRTEEHKKKLSQLMIGNQYLLGYVFSKESKNKMRESQIRRFENSGERERYSLMFKGENNPFYGKHHTEETKELLRNLATGKIWSEESKEKLKQSFLLNGHPMANYEWSQEQRKYMSEVIKNSEKCQKLFFKSGSDNIMFEIGENHPLYGSRFKWVNNGINNKRLAIGLEIEEGWVEGKIQKTVQSKRGMIMINNRQINKMVTPYDFCKIWFKQGFRRGMIKR